MPISECPSTGPYVSNVSDVLARGSAGRAVLTNATVVAAVNGTTVSQTSDRNFSDASSPPDEDWTVAADAHGVREFGMTVDRSSLEDQSGLGFGLFSGDTFNVTFRSASATYNVSVYRDSGAGTTEVAVTNATSGRSFGPCTDDTGSETEIDLTGATVGGEHCPALERLGAVPEPFDVEFANADSVYGTYSLVANTSIVPGTMGSPGPGEEDTLYAVWVDVRFQSQRVDYRTNVTVAPGEIDA